MCPAGPDPATQDDLAGADDHLRALCPPPHERDDALLDDDSSSSHSDADDLDADLPSAAGR